MGLRVISTKLTEEEHSKIMEMCKESQTILSTFLKQCIMELVENFAYKEWFVNFV